jgi:hypothetical protein
MLGVLLRRQHPMVKLLQTDADFSGISDLLQVDNVNLILSCCLTPSITLR